jgi:hypothetical protein
VKDIIGDAISPKNIGFAHNKYQITQLTKILAKTVKTKESKIGL